MSTYSAFLGIDCGAEQHVLHLIDAAGKPHHRSVPNSPFGFNQLRDWLLARVEQPSTTAVALESPDHPLVEFLGDLGCRPFHINPKQLDRLRDRQFPSGAKDDRRDAFVLADALRSDRHLFIEIPPPSPALIALRALSRRADRLSQDLVRDSNRLWDILIRFAPDLLRLCGGANKPILWDLLDLGADPHVAATLDEAAVASLLRRRRIRRFSPEDALAALQAPRLSTNDALVNAFLEDITLLVESLRRTQELLAHTRRQLKHLLPQFGRDAQIIDSFPGIDVLHAACFLVEAPQAIAERNLQALRCLCGVAPVTRQSGGRRTVRMRRACSSRLRDACFFWPLTAIANDPWAKTFYAACRRRGLSHPHALRALADRLITRLVAALRHDTLYRPVSEAATPTP